MTPPQGGGLTLDESLRVAVLGGRADAELIAPAIETLAREYRRLSPDGPMNDHIKGVVAAGENAGIADALVCLDWLFVCYRVALDRAHAAEVAKVLP